jgi:hypothetical protein
MRSSAYRGGERDEEKAAELHGRGRAGFAASRPSIVNGEVKRLGTIQLQVSAEPWRYKLDRAGAHRTVTRWGSRWSLEELIFLLVGRRIQGGIFFGDYIVTGSCLV